VRESAELGPLLEGAWGERSSRRQRDWMSRCAARTPAHWCAGRAESGAWV